jgi:hypothetical protein
MRYLKLYESFDVNKIYHFTSYLNLYYMLKDGFFICKYNDLSKYDYDYAISTTRNKSLKWKTCRITLDYDKIKRNYVIKPVRYTKLHNQSEERIFTNNKVFPIFNYVIKIDILDIHKTDDTFVELLKLLKERNIQYDLVKNF